MRAITKHRARRRLKTTVVSTIIIPALVAGTALSISALPNRLGDDTVYTLQRTYTKGDIDRYKVKTEMHSDGLALQGAKKVVVTLVLKEETQDINADGNAVLNDTFEEANADFGTTQMDVVAFLPAITQTRDKQSHIIDTKSKGGNPDMGDMATQAAKQLMFFYSARPVKVGESWEIADDSKSAVPSKAKGKGTLIAVETLAGMQTAKIRVVTDSGSEMEDPQTHQKTKVTAHFEGTGNMDIKTGKVVALSGKTTFKGGPITDNVIDWKLKTGDDKDDTKPAGDKQGAEKQ